MFIVQKYGGSSLQTAEDIKKVAGRIAELYHKKTNLIVVVSAMGNTTNELTDLAKKISPSPSQRELDMLLTTGERISMALLSMALIDLDVPAISFTGSQAGVMTNDSFNNAQILDIKPIRVEEALKQNKVVVLAGFQGVSPKTKEITTLGRGGSDTTAIAMAAHFKASRCEILKDVDGIATADPKVNKNAKVISEIAYNHLTDMTFWGARFLHHRAAELAQHLNVPVFIGPSHKTGIGTIIKGESLMYENQKILSVNSHAFVREVSISADELHEAIDKVQATLTKKQLPMLQILHSERKERQWKLLLTGAKEHITPINGIFNETNELSTVTTTCLGLVASSKAAELAKKLKSNGIETKNIIYAPLSITFVLDQRDREKAIHTLSMQHAND
ncbi:MAG: hypothetical protein A4S09_00875 [Proteobacteria bacterium SG_bin7]|nr:MAG: hypothetical protein A4S09_00875 [Proteobacteria bacterium SG_bin7]